MKRLLLISLLLVIIVPTFSLASVIAPARIRMLDGDVMFRTPESNEWLPAAVNTPLDEGDAIWCPNDARAEIQLSNGSIIRIDESSQLDLIANEEDFTHLHLSNGKAYLKTGKTLAPNSLQIDADDTTILPAARTRLRIDMLPYNQEDVSIFKGSAYVEGNGSRTRVRAGEHIALEEGHNALLSLNPPDSWENWNMDRDRDQARSARSESYLPEELRGYSSELDSNGRWERVPEYGMVWRPTVIVSNDWAPYRTGRWIWKNDDYVWISYESWGWIPYHYGRWAIISGLGWCWVPPERGDVYWGPGYVGWYHTGNHVGWTPLAPGEIFYGRRHYGRSSINVTTTTVTTGNIRYRNGHARNGTTIINRNDFIKGRVITTAPSVNISVSVSAGSPRINPIRETRIPIIKQTPPRVVPPVIKHRDNRELRQKFPRINPVSEPIRRQQHNIQESPKTLPLHSREKQTGLPPTAQSDERKGITPSAGDNSQSRNDRRQNTAPQPPPTAVIQPSQTAPQPGVQVQQNRPAPSSNQPVQNQNAPVETRRNRISTGETAPVVPQRIERQKPEVRPGEIREKKVWKVISRDDAREQSSQEKNKDNEKNRGERKGKEK